MQFAPLPKDDLVLARLCTGLRDSRREDEIAGLLLKMTDSLPSAGILRQILPAPTRRWVQFANLHQKEGNHKAAQRR